MEFDYLKAIYRRNNKNQPCVWYAEKDGISKIKIYHGIIGKTINSYSYNVTREPLDEINSKFKEKYKVGYKHLHEIKDNVTLPVEGELYSFLDAYLEYNRTTSDGSLLAMLAKVYTSNVFKNNSSMYGQYKINGLRCFVSAIPNNGDMFKPIKLRFQSREGTYWNSLSNLEDYLLRKLPKALLDKMLDEEYILDGELYLPGFSVNQINHFVKNAKCEENKLLQYWCYDLAIDDMPQVIRFNELLRFCSNDKCIFISKEHHRNNNKRFVLLPTTLLSNDEEAVVCRDRYLNYGFEGLILRKPLGTYQFGKRNQTMLKFKAHTDGKFQIIDIYPEGVKRPNIPLFLCKNDINNETFECHVGGSVSYQEFVLKNKKDYIGRYMHVNFGERSGVNQLPFHIKETNII